jgi:hypothetical protein
VRTQQAVLLDDAAAANVFSADPYLARHATRSILCLPLLSRGQLTGSTSDSVASIRNCHHLKCRSGGPTLFGRVPVRQLP